MIKDGAVTDAKFTGVLSVIKGGTGATDADGARANLYAAALVHSHDLATSSASGFMSAADKAKLDSITPPFDLAYAIGESQNVVLGRNDPSASFNFSSSGMTKHNCSTSSTSLVIARAGVYEISLMVAADILQAGNNSSVTFYAGSLSWKGRVTMEEGSTAYTTRVNLNAGDQVSLFMTRDGVNLAAVTYIPSLSVKQIA